MEHRNTRTQEYSGVVHSALSGVDYSVGCTVVHTPVSKYTQIIDADCKCGGISKTNDETNKYCPHFAVFLKELIDTSNKSTPLFSYDPLVCFEERYYTYNYSC